MGTYGLRDPPENNPGGRSQPGRPQEGVVEEFDGIDNQVWALDCARAPCKNVKAKFMILN